MADAALLHLPNPQGVETMFTVTRLRRAPADSMTSGEPYRFAVCALWADDELPTVTCRIASSSSSSRPARMPSMVGWTRISGMMPTCDGACSGQGFRVLHRACGFASFIDSSLPRSICASTFFNASMSTLLPSIYTP